MSSLKMNEKKIFEQLFDRGGYVLDFTDGTFSEFFREHEINIEAEKYYFNGTSKMKRLRAFWEIEPDYLVGKILKAFLEYACVLEELNPEIKIKANKIISRLGFKNIETEQLEEDKFLEQEFKDISIHKLNLSKAITEALEQRIKEIEQCLKSNSALATIFLCGSALEGILLGVAKKNHEIFNSANTSPKDNNGKTLKFQDWTLNNFIDVAKEIEFLNEDVKKFSHALRDFRNYIHPYQQVRQKFTPDKYTAKICFQVLKTAVYQITKK